MPKPNKKIVRVWPIVPATGTALLFQHMLLHAGKRVTSGTKLVLRSDVLYRPVD